MWKCIGHCSYVGSLFRSYFPSSIPLLSSLILTVVASPKSLSKAPDPESSIIATTYDRYSTKPAYLPIYSTFRVSIGCGDEDIVWILFPQGMSLPHPSLLVAGPFWCLPAQLTVTSSPYSTLCCGAIIPCHMAVRSLNTVAALSHQPCVPDMSTKIGMFFKRSQICLVKWGKILN